MVVVFEDETRLLAVFGRFQVSAASLSGTIISSVQNSQVVVAQLSDEQCLSVNLIDHAMLICDAPGPVPGHAMFQRLRLANACTGCPLAFLNERIDALEDCPVSALSVQVIVQYESTPNKGV